jgi:hypothetical protein
MAHLDAFWYLSIEGNPHQAVQVPKDPIPMYIMQMHYIVLVLANVRCYLGSLKSVAIEACVFSPYDGSILVYLVMRETL